MFWVFGIRTRNQKTSYRKEADIWESTRMSASFFLIKISLFPAIDWAAAQFLQMAANAGSVANRQFGIEPDFPPFHQALLKRQTRHHPSDTGFSNNFRFRFWGFRALPKRAKTRAPKAHLHVSVGHRHQLSVHNVPGILKIIGASRQRHDPVGGLYRHR